MSKQQQSELCEFLKRFMPPEMNHEEIALDIIKGIDKHFPDTRYATIEYLGGPTQINIPQ